MAQRSSFLSSRSSGEFRRAVAPSREMNPSNHTVPRQSSNRALRAMQACVAILFSALTTLHGSAAVPTPGPPGLPQSDPRLQKVAAALIHRQFDRIRSRKLLERAVLAAPDRPDLLWLTIQMCDALSGCDSAPFEARLLVLAPSNGAVRLAQLQRDKDSGGCVQREQLLDALSHADRVDSYWTTLSARLTRAILAGSKISPDTVMVSTIGVLAGLAAPGLQIVMQTCRDVAVTSTDVPQRCRAIAALLQRADTLLMEQLGTELALRVWPADSSEHQTLLDTKRDLAARAVKMPALDTRFLTPTDVTKYTALMLENRREQDVMDQWAAYADSLVPAQVIRKHRSRSNGATPAPASL